MFRILLITALIAQAMAYYPYQPQEEKMSEPMPQPQPQSMKKNQNGGTNGKGKNMAGDDDDGEQQQMMQAPPIRILNMKSQVKKDGTYSYMYDTENGISMQEMGYVKQGPPSGKNGGSSGKHDEDDGKPEYITVAQGSYSYTSPEGVQVTVNYIADENGFQTFDDSEGQDQPDDDQGMQMPMKQPANGKGSSGGGTKKPQRPRGGKQQMRPAPKMPSKPQMMMEQEKPQWNQEAAYSSPVQQYQYSFEGTESSEGEQDDGDETPEQLFGHFFRH